MTSLPSTGFLALSGALLAIGLFGILTRRNFILLLIAIEIAMNAAILNFVYFARVRAGAARAHGPVDRGRAHRVRRDRGRRRARHRPRAQPGQGNDQRRPGDRAEVVGGDARSPRPAFSWAFLVPLLQRRSRSSSSGSRGPARAASNGAAGSRSCSRARRWSSASSSAVGEMLSPGTYTDVQFTWLHLAPAPGPFPNGFSLVVGTLVDPISALMLIVVTVVGFLVMLYSIGYMHHDRGLPRYYAELSLFLAAMSGLVLVGQPARVLRLLGARRGLLLLPHRILLREAERCERGEGGVPRHPGRGRDVPARDLPLLLRLRGRGPRGLGRLGRERLPVRERQRRAVPQQGLPCGEPDAAHGRGDHDPGRCGGEERAVPAPRLAPGRDGGPDDRLGAHPRRDDGRRGRLPPRGHQRVHRLHGDRLAGDRRGRRASRRSSPPAWRSSIPTSSG